MKEGNYKGLPNIGATCYINSFIQTLFMTPEFRDGIFQWTYNPKIHPKPQDSILYQLQKLFAKLYLKSSDISVKELVKSFQWQDEQAFDQQDIQEFNRVLFEALQKSFRANSKGHHSELIKQLYEGELVHYTKCLECRNQSSREETFQDLILVIKNIYEKIYSGSLELSLQRYVKPQFLDENNLYNCQICNKKVRAERGVRFIKLPKLLNIVIQRFHFDYFTESRNKINDKFTFPHVLNFNHYFNGYEDIPNRLNEDSSEYFLKEQAPVKKNVRPKPMNIGKKVISKAGTTATQPSVAGKTKTKPSSNTKSFLQQMRRKKMHQQSVQNQDLIYVSGNAQLVSKPQTQNKKFQETNSSLSTAEEIAKKTQTKPSLIKPEENIEVNNSVDNIKMQSQGKQMTINGFSMPPPPPTLTLGTPSISEPFRKEDIHTNPTIINNITMAEELAKKLQEKQILDAEKDARLKEQQKINREAIVMALKDGPLVYELYSILVHSGTSNAGHYFSYVKSFENGKWYVFNDDRVDQINVTQIQKTFGGTGLSNAYVLYYRLAQQNNYQCEAKVPEYLKRVIQEQEQAFQARKRTKQMDLQNTLILKIYFQLGVKTIQIMKNSSMELLFRKAKQLFNIETYQGITKQSKSTLSQNTFIKDENIRIRLFNPANDIKLDTYRGKQQNSLEELGIRSYQNFLLEVKGDSEEFEDYVAGYMSIRIALWKQNMSLVSLDEKNISLHKVAIHRDAKMNEVEQVIQVKRKETGQSVNNQNSSVCIIKRHQNDEYLYHEIINLPDYYQKTVDEVGIFEGQILFVEPDAENLNWPREFENQINRITIKFNSIKSSEPHNITTDSRISLNELKQKICQILGESVQEIIVRRGNRSGLELKNGKATLKENRFINGTTLFLEKGIPAKMGQIRIQLYMSEDASPSAFNRLHEFTFIADVPVDTSFKASDVKLRFKQILKKIKGLQIEVDKMRIREKVNDKIGKIYREKPMKQQQLIEKRQIAIQLKEDAIQMKDFSIYVRIWDQLTWQLSPKHQFVVNKNTTMKDLAVQVHKIFSEQDQSNAILPEDMDICRILSIHKFNIIDLVDMEYFGMESEASVLGEPMFVNSDGLLYVIKQTGLQPRQLTKEQQSIFGGKIKHYVRPTKGRAPPTTTTKKEKGISIKVVEKESEVEEKENPAQNS